MPVKPALCFRGINTAYAVINDVKCVRVVSNISLKEHDHSIPVFFPLGSHPLRDTVDKLCKFGLRKGITKRAEYFLKHALNGGIDESAPLPPDEIAGAAPEAATKEPTRSPTTAKPAKPAVAPPERAAGPSRTAGSDVIRKLAVELKLEPTKLRKILRSKGLSAPYTNEELIRSKLK